jgi:formylglycine-generating enzyme
MYIRLVTLVAIAFLAHVQDVRAETPLNDWCDATCNRLFSQVSDKPDCMPVVHEAVLRGDKVVLEARKNRDCEKKLSAYQQIVRLRRSTRDGILNANDCIDWCKEAGRLRLEQAVPAEATELWLLLRDLEVCDSGSVDPLILAQVPLRMRCRGMEFVPAGKYMMGCAETRKVHCRKREMPEHVVYLHGFFVDVHEVTVAAYKNCVEAGYCTKPKSYQMLRFFNWGDPTRMLHPVNGVDWEQSDRFCRFEGKRLCTEAEWEKAARGPDGRLYPWGNDPPDASRALIDDGMDASEEGKPWPLLTTTQQVCTYPDGNSPYGLCDLAGNVWEWVSDWYDSDYYSKSPMVNPKGPEKGVHKAIRGGRYYRVGFFLRASNRGFFKPEEDFTYLGFRCCMSLRQGHGEDH